MEESIISDSVEMTFKMGRLLGRSITEGAVIALVGALGTGKTHFIKGLASGLDVEDPEAVTSPTFTLINEYEGRLPLFHIDAYRFENSRQLEALGFDELCLSGGIVVVEWADKVETLIEPYQPIHIAFKHLSEQKREIKIASIDHKLLEKMKDFD